MKTLLIFISLIQCQEKPMVKVYYFNIYSNVIHKKMIFFETVENLIFMIYVRVLVLLL